MDSDGDGMGDNAQAIYEAGLAAQQEEEDAAARMRLIIGVVLVLLVGAGAGVFYMRSRSGVEGDEVAKDFGMPDMNAQPAAANTGYDPMATAGYAAQPAQSYDAMATAGYAAQPAAAAYDPMATQAAVQPVDDSALNALVEPEPVAAAVAMPEAVAQPEPVAAPAEPTVVNQWTDENGHTWRVMSDGTNRWWNGTDWQKV
jgi:flagellar basal body-associated protein FliL